MWLRNVYMEMRNSRYSCIILLVVYKCLSWINYGVVNVRPYDSPGLMTLHRNKNFYPECWNVGGKGRYYIQDESSTRREKWVKKEKKPFVVDGTFMHVILKIWWEENCSIVFVTASLAFFTHCILMRNILG